MVVAALATTAAPALAIPATAPFEMPASLTPVVGFWARVYAVWPSTQVVIHDAGRVDVVYRVLDLSEFAPDDQDSAVTRTDKAAGRTQAVQAARAEFEEALSALDASRPPTVKGLKGAQREAFVAWEASGDTSVDRFGDAARRVRSQRGLADRYARALGQSGRFMGAVQQALRNAGLPDGLVALAFTESLMDINARSVSGALGIWQFLSGTGREYLSINAALDERRDPVLASVAAARYLTNSRSRLGSWGVAITAYNYGTNGMARAVSQLKTSNIEVVLRDYRTKQFGFAARNYYAEFLASLHVLSHANVYFPGVKIAAPWTFDAVALPRRARVTDLVGSGVSRVDLAELNPALTPTALAGGVILPEGLVVRVTRGRGAAVLEALKKGKAPDDVTGRAHVLKKGETLMGVARRYGVTLGELCSANSLDPYAPTAAGITLSIPSSLGFSIPPEAAVLAKKGGVTTVSFAPPSELVAFATPLANRRPAVEPTLVAYANASRAVVAARPAASPPAPAMVLTAAVGRPEQAAGLVELTAEAPRAMGRVRRHPLQHALVTAGPPTSLPFASEPTPDQDHPDVLAGGEVVPDVDVATGLPSGAEPWTPPALPPPRVQPNS